MAAAVSTRSTRTSSRSYDGDRGIAGSRHQQSGSCTLRDIGRGSGSGSSTRNTNGNTGGQQQQQQQQ